MQTVEEEEPESGDHWICLQQLLFTLPEVCDECDEIMDEALKYVHGDDALFVAHLRRLHQFDTMRTYLRSGPRPEALTPPRPHPVLVVQSRPSSATFVLYLVAHFFL